MKKLLGLFIFSFFFCSVSFAENIGDIWGKNKKKGSLDFHYKCLEERDDKITWEFGLKKIGDATILFGYDPEEKIYDIPYSSIIEYKRKLRGDDVNIFFHFNIIQPDFPF